MGDHPRQYHVTWYSFSQASLLAGKWVPTQVRGINRVTLINEFLWSCSCLTERSLNRWTMLLKPFVHRHVHNHATSTFFTSLLHRCGSTSMSPTLNCTLHVIYLTCFSETEDSDRIIWLRKKLLAMLRQAARASTQISTKCKIQSNTVHTLVTQVCCHQQLHSYLEYILSDQ